MSELNIVPALKVSKRAMRLINQRAFALGGNDHFQQVRQYLLEKVDRRVKAGLTTTDSWLEDMLADSSPDEMMRWQIGGGSV